MKVIGTSTIVLSAAALICSSLTAAAQLPKGAFAVTDLDAAREEALKSKRGIALLFADPEPKNEKQVDANKAAIRSLKAHSVLVFVDFKNGDMETVPTPVYTISQDPTLGAFIPRAAVVSPDLMTLWSKASGTELGGESARKALSRVKKEATEKAAEWKPGGGDSDPRKKIYKWIMKEKKHAEGVFDGLDDEKLLLIDKNGRKGSIEVEKLGEASIAFAKKLSAMGSAPASFEIEDWTSSDGKTIRAKFVSIAGDKVSLELESGKTVTIPLSRLNSTSAEKAQGYAEK